jgi:hypothetical protein
LIDSKVVYLRYCPNVAFVWIVITFKHLDNVSNAPRFRGIFSQGRETIIAKLATGAEPRSFQLEAGPL